MTYFGKLEEKTCIYIIRIVKLFVAGYLAKVILPAGSKDIPIGRLLCIITPNAEDVAKFKDYVAPGLVTYSILFCWLLTIKKDQCVFYKRAVQVCLSWFRDRCKTNRVFESL